MDTTNSHPTSTLDRLQSLLETVTIAGDLLKVRLVTSFLEYYSKNDYLSPRQEALMAKYEEFYRDNLDTMLSWSKDYALDKAAQKTFALAIQYYKANGPYFSRIVEEYETFNIKIERSGGVTDNCDETETGALNPYVPGYDSYHKMTSNRHFVSYQKEVSSEPRYSSGALVEGRSGTRFSGNLYMIVRPTGKVRAAKGSKEYLVLRVASPNYAKSWAAGPTLFTHQSTRNSEIQYIEEKSVKIFKRNPTKAVTGS
jgi:hypothetical protein